ncbi:MAG: hypothetical protein F2690_04025 [Actinobacteria bacterium]|uniref:Unannotated protein n=1 Tax=freshwater metagenome TaxID=449393 RepID=A0A6J6S6W0_9ZZZZ|nr:hypothetical protein [Actinomycetota bacterium]MSX72039.1 hypothetical protein [Actinomycetota bacterium]MSY69718.1 hypothetical protein [Actinomycetota bacterium]MTA76132.1 hypothetical protein [Actinomycetota bacterium]
MEFSVTKGNPTPEESAAIELAMAQHKRQELKPVMRRSLYGLPQLRQGLSHKISFGTRKNS